MLEPDGLGRGGIGRNDRVLERKAETALECADREPVAVERAVDRVRAEAWMIEDCAARAGERATDAIGRDDRRLRRPAGGRARRAERASHAASKRSDAGITIALAPDHAKMAPLAKRIATPDAAPSLIAAAGGSGMPSGPPFPPALVHASRMAGGISFGLAGIGVGMVVGVAAGDIVIARRSGVLALAVRAEGAIAATCACSSIPSSHGRRASCGGGFPPACMAARISCDRSRPTNAPESRPFTRDAIPGVMPRASPPASPASMLLPVSMPIATCAPMPTTEPTACVL